MTNGERVRALWGDMTDQNWDRLEGYFTPDAVIDWPNTGERFDPHGYMRANSEYPGRWDITVERVEENGDSAISVVRIELRGGEISFFAVSFFTFDEAGQISRLTEYFGDNGDAPEWRRKLGIARPITD